MRFLVSLLVGTTVLYWADAISTGPISALSLMWPLRLGHASRPFGQFANNDDDASGFGVATYVLCTCELHSF
jgi:hypothetical protein